MCAHQYIYIQMLELYFQVLDSLKSPPLPLTFVCLALLTFVCWGKIALNLKECHQFPVNHVRILPGECADVTSSSTGQHERKSLNVGKMSPLTDERGNTDNISGCGASWGENHNELVWTVCPLLFLVH